MPLAGEDPQGRDRDIVFRRALQERGWIEDRNLRIAFRWAARDPQLFRKYAAELVALSPDVILAGGGLVVASLQQATQTIPIVFTATIDPVSRGFVQTLARPGGNMTGFVNIEYSFSAKWLELLMQLAPDIKRVAVLHDPSVIGQSQFDTINSLVKVAGGPFEHLELSPIDVSDEDRMERAIDEFAARPDGGLIVTASIASTTHSEGIIDLASRHRLPAVYPNRFHAMRGGLISYGPVFLEQYRGAATYVDRILRGEKPADLPVQRPVKYEMVLNRKTARRLKLSIPDIIYVQATDFID
jgi:putative ABC transport system substrate-binding protein